MAKRRTETSLCEHIDDLVSRMRQLVPQAMKHWDEEAIHDARVATRRLKAAMDLLGGTIPPRALKRFLRGLRIIRRRLGPLRDLDVMMTHLRGFSRGRHAAPAGWLGEQLLRQRAQQRERALRKAPIRRMLARLGAWWGVHDDIAAVEQSAPLLLAEVIPLQLQAFRQHADRLARGGTDPATTPADPHAVRIAGKLLRYTLELAVVAGCPLPRSVLATFKRLQDALGLWHDFVVLTEACTDISIHSQIALHQPELFGKLLDLARAAWLKSLRELARFKKMWLEQGDQLSADILAAVAKVAPATIAAPPPAPGPLAVAPQNDPAPPTVGEDASLSPSPGTPGEGLPGSSPAGPESAQPPPEG